MKIKIFFILLVSFITNTPFTASAAEPGDASLTLGMVQITDEALDVLAGTGVTIDDSDTVSIITGDFYVSPNLALEAGIITGAEVSASVSDGDSGTLYGNSYSISGTVTIKAQTDPSYLFGVKYSSPESGPLSVYGKTGMLFWNVSGIVTVSGTITYAGTAYSGSSSATFYSAEGSDPYIGLGMSYAIGKDNSIGFDYISTEVDDADISGYGISWVRNF
jgi:outer membrane protein W